jgi:hypothetical protein
MKMNVVTPLSQLVKIKVLFATQEPESQWRRLALIRNVTIIVTLAVTRELAIIRMLLVLLDVREKVKLNVEINAFTTVTCAVRH